MNYNNPYQQYPYTIYNNGYQQPMQYQQPQQQQMQTTYLPLTFVNGIEGAKAFIVGANQTIYLKDSDSNILFEKKADNQGKYTIVAFELKQIDLNNFNNIKNSSNKVSDDFVTRDNLKNYVTFEAFTKLQEELQNLRAAIEKKDSE